MSHKIQEIEEQYAENLSKNSKMQQELIKLKKKNYKKKNGSDSENILELSRILSDISKITFLAQEYNDKKYVNLSKVLSKEFNVIFNSPDKYIEKIKKETEKLRLNCADIYAELCGSACNTQ